MGTCWEGMVGLECAESAEGAPLLFADHLPSSAFSVVSETGVHEIAPQLALDHGASERRDQERRQLERRRHPRHGCAGTASMWENVSQHAVTGRVNEISLGGCYVEIMSPLRIGAALRMELEIAGRTLRMEGIVRASQPAMGMGI